MVLFILLALRWKVCYYPSYSTMKGNNMDKKYRTEWLVNLVKGKEGSPDFENERIHIYNPDANIGLVFNAKKELPDEILEEYKQQIDTLGTVTGNGSFASKSDEIARDSAFCDFMRRLEMFMDYASNFIDVESITTKELTELDKCVDDE